MIRINGKLSLTGQYNVACYPENLVANLSSEIVVHKGVIENRDLLSSDYRGKISIQDDGVISFAGDVDLNELRINQINNAYIQLDFQKCKKVIMPVKKPNYNVNRSHHFPTNKYFRFKYGSTAVGDKIMIKENPVWNYSEFFLATSYYDFEQEPTTFDELVQDVDNSQFNLYEVLEEHGDANTKAVVIEGGSSLDARGCPIKIKIINAKGSKLVL